MERHSDLYGVKETMNVLNKDKILEEAKHFAREGKFDRSLKEYEKILKVDPKDMRVKLQVAELFIKLRKVPEAIQSYRDVAGHYTQDGFYLKAVTVYKNILRLNPSLIDVNKALAELYDKMGVAKDAVHQYEILANAAVQGGNYGEALTLWEKMVKLDPKSKNHRIRLAEAYQRDNRQDEAIQQYEELARQYKTESAEEKKIVDLYEKILPNRPDNHAMLTELIDIYYAKKELKEALRWLEKRKDVVPKDPHLLSMQAEIYATVNQLDSARGKYQDLAELYLERGDKPAALKAYGEILVFLPEEGETIRKLVEVIHPGSFATLVKKAEKRRSDGVESEVAAVAVAVAEKERKVGAEKKPVVADKKQGEESSPPQSRETRNTKLPEEKTPLKESSGDPQELKLHLSKAQSNLNLAKMYRKTGLTDEAVKEIEQAEIHLTKILQADPDNASAQELMDQLTALKA